MSFPSDEEIKRSELLSLFTGTMSHKRMRKAVAALKESGLWGSKKKAKTIYDRPADFDEGYASGGKVAESDATKRSTTEKI